MNDDYLLDEEPVVQDEYAQYLDAEENEDPAEAQRKAEEEEAARLQAIVDRKIAERFMRSEPAPVPARAPEPVVDPEDVINKMAEDITNDLALDPKQAVRKLITTARALNEQTSASAQARANRMLIESYRAARSADPMFEPIAEDFDKVTGTYTDEQLGKSSAAQVKWALENAENAALGQYYKRQVTEKRKEKAAPPPSYSSGRSAGAAAPSAKRLNERQRDLVRLGKSAGLDDKAIRELVKENA